MKSLKFKPAINEADEPNNDFLSIVFFLPAPRPSCKVQCKKSFVNIKL